MNGVVINSEKLKKVEDTGSENTIVMGNLQQLLFRGLFNNDVCLSCSTLIFKIF